MQALQVAREHDTIALCSAVYDEIREVLSRPKITLALPPDRQQEILEFLSAAAIWTEPDQRVVDCPDPGDNKYLELAMSAGASVIVSSDRYLLSMAPLAAHLDPAPSGFPGSHKIVHLTEHRRSISLSELVLLLTMPPFRSCRSAPATP